MIQSKVFFLGKYKDKFSNDFLKVLKKNFLNVDYYFCKNFRDRLPKKKIRKWKGDYIISFRSYIILKKNFLKKAKIASLNFHPGPPKYRGIGCVNFAIMNKEKFYGSTVHLINEKIDNGKILDVLFFKISKKNTVEDILHSTYKNQIKQLKKIILKIKNKKFCTLIKKKENSLYSWSKKFYNRKNLNKLYRISKNIKKEKLELLLKATVTKKYKPYIIIGDKKFYYYESKK